MAVYYCVNTVRIVFCGLNARNWDESESRGRLPAPWSNSVVVGVAKVAGRFIPQQVSNNYLKDIVIYPWESLMRRLICFTAAVSITASAGVAAGASHFAGSELLPMAKVTLAQARSTALVARPGKITDQELEKERGGTGLRYSFDILSKGKTFEVGVDARTGKVLENDGEGSNPD
jgi:hypothetical protein